MSNTSDAGLGRRTVLGGAALVAFVASADASQAASPSLRVIAELDAKPGKEDELRDLLIAFSKGATSEPGCLSYTLMQVQGEPTRFLTYEIWTSKAALDTHLQTPAIKAATPKLATLLSKPFNLTLLTALG